MYRAISGSLEKIFDNWEEKIKNQKKLFTDLVKNIDQDPNLKDTIEQTIKSIRRCFLSIQPAIHVSKEEPGVFEIGDQKINLTVPNYYALSIPINGEGLLEEPAQTPILSLEILAYLRKAETSHNNEFKIPFAETEPAVPNNTPLIVIRNASTDEEEKIIRDKGDENCILEYGQLMAGNISSKDSRVNDLNIKIIFIINKTQAQKFLKALIDHPKQAPLIMRYLLARIFGNILIDEIDAQRPTLESNQVPILLGIPTKMVILDNLLFNLRRKKSDEQPISGTTFYEPYYTDGSQQTKISKIENLIIAKRTPAQ